MHCDQIENVLDDYLDGPGDDSSAAAVALHVQTCEACALELEALQTTRNMLRQLPVPPPSEGFFDRAVDAAAATERRDAHSPWRPLAAAAAIVLALCGSLLAVNGGSVPAPAGGHSEIALTLGDVTPVKLLFTSAEPLEDARLSLELPVGIELMGYDGRTDLSWTTNLEAGRNVLRLPLVGVAPGTEQLVARLEHPAGTRTFRLDVTVKQPETHQ